MNSLKFGILLTVTTCSHSAIFNTDSRYGTWNKQVSTDTFVRIPVYIDAAKYSATELQNIRQAMAQFNSGGIRTCVQYQEITAPNLVTGRDYVYISPVYNSGVRELTCATFPGRNLAQFGRGQKLLLVGGAGGCTSDVRDLMRYLTIVACGMRNEYKRADRTINVNTANIDPSLTQFNLYSIYDTSKYSTCPSAPAFDPTSITMVQPTKFGIGGTATVWTGPLGGTSQQLSINDCNCCAAKYTCTATCP